MTQNSGWLRARRFWTQMALSAILSLGGALAPDQALAQNSDVPEEGVSDYDPSRSRNDATPPSRARRSSDGRYENVFVGPTGEGSVIEALIQAAGGQVLRRAALSGLGQYSIVAVFPTEGAVQEVLSAMPSAAPGSGHSLNITYHFAQSASPRIYAPQMIGDTAAGSCRLARPVRIGMIDGPINPGHPALAGTALRHESLVSTNRLPNPDHATGVAALLIGEDSAGRFGGYARGASLDVVSVFERFDEGDEAAVDNLVLALDRLVGRGAEVINLSIAGPESEAFGRAISAAAGQGVVMVGAAGNGRSRNVAYPAAFDEVIAVTAVDAARRRYPLANTGPEIEFAAPGVDLYTARNRGGGYVSGTSFATPIVAGVVARSVARGTRGVESVRAQLRGAVQPLGEGEHNAETGFGLVRGGC